MVLVRAPSRLEGLERCSCLYGLLVGEDQVIGCSLPAQVQKGGQAARRKAAPLGANDSLRVSMCQIATVSFLAMSTWATLAPALFAEPALVSLVALGVGGVAQGVHGRLQQRPAQVAGALLGERAAAV